MTNEFFTILLPAFFSVGGTLALSVVFLMLGSIGQRNKKLGSWQHHLFYVGVSFLIVASIIRLYTRFAFTGAPISAIEVEERAVWLGFILLLQGIAFGLGLIAILSYLEHAKNPKPTEFAQSNPRRTRP